LGKRPKKKKGGLNYWRRKQDPREKEKKGRTREAFVLPPTREKGCLDTLQVRDLRVWRKSTREQGSNESKWKPKSTRRGFH